MWVYLLQTKRYGDMMSKIVINLEALLVEKGVSKTQLCYQCRLQRTQLNNYCKNKVVRVDLHTIAKICDCLECKVEDILKLERDEESQEN